MKVNRSQKLPIKMWLDDIEEGALSQARDLANLFFAWKWIAIMPDSHQGYGMPIGGVLASKEMIGGYWLRDDCIETLADRD